MSGRFELGAGGVAVFRPVGRIDLLTAPALKAQLTAAIAEGRRRIVVNLSDVSHLDSVGLGALISVLKATRAVGGYLRIARPTDQARRVLEMTALQRVLTPFGSVEEALLAS
jgi:anti-anti-sigma factor